MAAPVVDEPRSLNQSATQTREPSGETAMPTGPSPAGSVSTTWFDAVSMTETDLLSGFETNAREVGKLTAMPAGAFPTGTVATTLRSARSITETSLLPWLVMYAKGAAKARLESAAPAAAAIARKSARGAPRAAGERGQRRRSGPFAAPTRPGCMTTSLQRFKPRRLDDAAS